MSTKDLLTLIIAGVAVIVALGTLGQACAEYLRVGRQSRAEMFFELRRRLKEDPLGRIAELVDLAGQDDAIGAKARGSLAKLSLREKRDYVGLFEEVGLMLEWGLVDREVAHYMFGYYAILCAESTAFWSGNINRWSEYWYRFEDFYREMKAESQTLRGEMRITGQVRSSRPVATAENRSEVNEFADADLRPRVMFKIPPVLRASVDGLREVEGRGANVGAALHDLAEHWPAAKSQIFSETGELNRYVNVYLNDEDVKALNGIDTPVAEGDTLVILPAMMGGADRS